MQRSNGITKLSALYHAPHFCRYGRKWHALEVEPLISDKWKLLRCLQSTRERYENKLSMRGGCLQIWHSICRHHSARISSILARGHVLRGLHKRAGRRSKARKEAERVEEEDGCTCEPRAPTREPLFSGPGVSSNRSHLSSLAVMQPVSPASSRRVSGGTTWTTRAACRKPGVFQGCLYDP